MSASETGREGHLVFETLEVQNEGAVLFAEISAPPMNLLGPELVRDLVSLIQQAEADDEMQVIVFRSADPDYFISHVDVTRIKENREPATKLTGEPSLGLLFRHLSTSARRFPWARWQGNSGEGVCKKSESDRSPEMFLGFRIGAVGRRDFAVFLYRVNAVSGG